MSKHRNISKIGILEDGSVILGLDDESHTYLSADDLEFILLKLKEIAADKMKKINKEE